MSTASCYRLRISAPSYVVPYFITWALLALTDAAQTGYALSVLGLTESGVGSAAILPHIGLLSTLGVGLLSCAVLACLIFLNYLPVRLLAFAFLAFKAWAVVSNFAVLGSL